MKKIKLKADAGCVYINTKTLCYTNCDIYVLRELAHFWVQINEKDVHSFIEDLKKQKIDESTAQTTSEVKTE